MEFTYFQELPYELLSQILIHLNYIDIKECIISLNLDDRVYDELWKDMIIKIDTKHKESSILNIKNKSNLSGVYLTLIMLKNLL